MLLFAKVYIETTRIVVTIQLCAACQKVLAPSLHASLRTLVTHTLEHWTSQNPHHRYQAAPGEDGVRRDADLANSATYV